jgi:hypothetical protein
MSNEIRDQIIAQLNMLSASLAADETDIITLEQGLEIECSNFVLNIDIDFGLCEECDANAPEPGERLCAECSDAYFGDVVDFLSWKKGDE